MRALLEINLVLQYLRTKHTLVPRTCLDVV
jgi:hypothetical protein